MKKLRIGLVCPYGWDTPGGVQNHVRDLAEFFIAEGHFVSVLAPVTDDSDLPHFLINAGKPTAIPFNGAVARLLFNPAAFARVRNWLLENEFDILHLHEPAVPSISLLALWASDGPIVGTFHAQTKKGATTRVIASIVEPAIERLSEKIAVSQAAYDTLQEHMDTTAHVIPNGIFADRYRDGVVEEKWTGATLGFIGRFEEPRKGLEVLIDALPIISRFVPDVRVLIAGPGDPEEISEDINSELRTRFQFLGKISESEKANFLKSISLYIAPNTGESPLELSSQKRWPVALPLLPAIFQRLLISWALANMAHSLNLKIHSLWQRLSSIFCVMIQNGANLQNREGFMPKGLTGARWLIRSMRFMNKC